MSEERESNYWRDTALTPKLYMIDYKCALLVIVFLIHIKLFTFIILVASLIFFGILEKYNLDMLNFFKLIRFKLAGRIRTIK